MNRHMNRRTPLKTSLLAARVLEGLREPAGMLADLLSPAPSVERLRPAYARPRRVHPQRTPPR